MLGSNSSRLLARNYAHPRIRCVICSCNYRESNYAVVQQLYVREKERERREISRYFYIFPTIPGINIVVRAVKMIGYLKPLRTKPR